MDFRIETISPQKAREYLDTSNGNRPIGKNDVRLYANAMRKGKWVLNGATICFDTDGHLLDGHHRLLAVIEANVPATFCVLRGLDPDVFPYIDGGRKRNIGQTLAIRDIKNYSRVGAIVNANETLLQYGRLTGNNGNATNSRSVAESYEAFSKDPEGYIQAATLFRSLVGKSRILPVSWGGGLYYYLTHFGGYSEEDVRPFFEALYDMDSNNIPVCSLLRKTIAKAALEGKQLKAVLLWVYLVKSWNAYITGQDIKVLRFGRAEEMPSLILNLNSQMI